MRHPLKLLVLALAGGMSVLFDSEPARAQADVNPPLPNVMLAVDTSGSMEYKSSSTSFPACDPSGATPSEKSRWVELVEVLTGSITDYRCSNVSRSSAKFRSEYSLNGVDAPDYRYINPYHRPLSGTCTAGPGTLPTINAYDFPATAIRYHTWDDVNTTCTTFQQANDGLLDSFLTRVRFGLMTFDTSTNPGTGVLGTTPDFAGGVAGTWSYFIGTSRQGKPAGCTTLNDQEVGARNAAAPPWEGRMVAFGDPSASSAAVTTKNQQIQQILLTTRPFEATPIAGMLHDARDLFWNDTTKDPLDTSKDFGPYNDPYVIGGCRKNFIVLLTDGEPNLDLRPYCAEAGSPAGQCPYQKPEDIALDLATNADTNKRIKTFVIGFAVSNVKLKSSQQVDCSKLTVTDLTDPNGLCATNPNETQLQACCTLSRIAYNGSTDRAYFADDMDGLRTAMSAILSQIATTTTSRTLPVFASGANVRDNFAASYRFFSSFHPQQFDLWSGVIERQRYLCKADPLTGQQLPEGQPIDSLKGDDFAANVNSGAGAARSFYSVLGTVEGGKIYSERTIRPYSSGDPDGLGTYTGAQYRGAAATFVSATTPAAMSIDSTTCTGLSADLCRDKYLKWDVGLDNGTIYNRCKTPGTSSCNLVGDVFHSTPVVVGKPSAFLRDETYETFASQQASRPLVLYASTNDGFLHAFKIGPGDTQDTFKVDAKENNELWAFIPPAVLPAIPSEYPGTHQVLLDGAAVIKDVIAQDVGNSVFKFERNAQGARTAATTWRTVLVQSFGGGRGGYFAIDVTNPVPSADGTKGPRFLWQLTTDSSGKPLFGIDGGTPLVTTVFFKDGTENKEVAVAILPGGSGGMPTGSSCLRKQTDFSEIDSAYQPRNAVNCYPTTGVGGRSLTIVRLDNGEVIRTFRQDPTEVPALNGKNLVLTSNLDSPITGQPVAFPGQPGAITDRVFVGDADGTLWRVNLASSDPNNWEMKLFFDAYPSSLGHIYKDGQPISTPPVLSVDVFGNVTLAISSGDQELLTATSGMRNYVWSLVEKPDVVNHKFASKANWYTQLLDGERVTGPISLFNGALYFSSYKPEPIGSLNVCSSGTSRVWGVDYILPKDPGNLAQGGKERLPQDPTAPTPTFVQFIDSTSNLIAQGSVIFGVSIAQLPTCFEETSSTDTYFGTGLHTAITNINPGKFQLVMHTGNVGTTPQGGVTKTVTIDLLPPPSTTTIDSWAAIVE